MPYRKELRALCYSAAEGIRLECQGVLDPTTTTRSSDSSSDSSSSNSGDESPLADCGEPLVQLLGRQAAGVMAEHARRGPPSSSSSSSSSSSLVLKRLDDIREIAYARFYAYVYKDLPLCWRQLYTDASILKFCTLFLRAGGEGGEGDRLDDMVDALDLALILAGGGGRDRGRAWIDRAFELLEAPPVRVSPAEDDVEGSSSSARPAKRAKTGSDDDDARDWSRKPSFPPDEPFTPPVSRPIRRVAADEMDMPAFQRYLDDSASASSEGPLPLIITGLTAHWPAFTEHPWHKPAYLLSRTLSGRRLVPVEVGRSYVDAGWGQRIMRFGDFLRQHIITSSSTTTTTTTAYLAQHALLRQLPHLRQDIRLPDHVYTCPPPPSSSSSAPLLPDEPLVNAWLGPPGTITPLHTDPYHNLLAQVVGRKYVRLYAARESAQMRARGKEDGVEMGNTSAVDVGVVEGWDATDYDDDDDEAGEDFREVPFVDCILEPGDTLYIPVGWWHYVRGLSVSFSVSIWWN